MGMFTWIAGKTAGLTFKTATRGILASWITWVVVAVLAAFGGLYAHDRHLNHLINNLEDGYVVKLERKGALIEVCAAQKVGLVAAIADQNKKIEEWKAEGDKLKIRSQDQQSKIDALEEANLRILAGIDSEEIGEGCEAAMTWMLAKAIEMQGE